MGWEEGQPGVFGDPETELLYPYKVSNHSEEFMDAQIWLSARLNQTGCLVRLRVWLISSKRLPSPHFLAAEMSTVFSSASVWPER